MRSCCDERRQIGPAVLPVLRRRGPAPQRGFARRLGVPLLRPCFHGQVQRTARQGSEPMTVVTAAGLGLLPLGPPAAPADPTRRTPADLKSLADAAGVAL